MNPFRHHQLMNHNLYRTLGIVVISFLLWACHSTPPSKTNHTTWTVQLSTLHNVLHFTGTLQPLQEYPIVSPLDAIIENMPYHYGQHLTKNTAVFILNSQELQKQYNDTLTEYLKAKDNYAIAQTKFIGTNDLWHAGLLSKNNYISEKSSLNTTHIALIEASRKLSELLEKMGSNHHTNAHLSQLSFKEFDKVRQALNRQYNLIRLKSPGNGVLLHPPRTNDDKANRISVGSTVKAGQVLALIGDLSGIRVEIDIPEIDMDKVKPDMPAVIHGIAFPKHTLQGKLVTINAEAATSNGQSLPSFTAIVEVKGLSKDQQAELKVGMSANVELNISSMNKILIPIAAIQQKNGKNVVQCIDKKGLIHEKIVITGATEGDQVIILSGLSVGDVISYEP